MAQVVRVRQIIIGVAIVASSTVGCAIQDTKAPPLQGPSEFSLAFTLSAVPDVLAQDGASQAQITVQARDSNGQPARGITFRIDMTVNGVLADFGSLSARTLVTGADGRATLTYTAPPATSGGVDNGQEVAIQVTPFGTDFANSPPFPRTVRIRLIPPGVISPGGPRPAFTFSPTSPTAFSDVTFDASTSVPAAGTLIELYTWNFGDGGTGRDVRAFHQFAAGSYVVTLTVKDTSGLSASTSQQVSVGAGALPTADFVFSPGAPVTNQEILFNGGTSRPGTGHTLVRYDWNFGSGSPRTGITVTKSYDLAGTYNVVLTVTDEVGQKASISRSLVVAEPAAGPIARFTMSPSPASVGQVVTFDGAPSTTAPPGGGIVRYEWNFGDLSPVVSTTAPTTSVTHQYSATNTAPGYTVTLTVFDNLGRSAATSQILRVQ